MSIITLKKLLYFLWGAAFLALGVVFAIPSHVGLGAFDALSYNGSLLFNLSVGATMNIILFILLVVLLILNPDKKYLLGTLLSFATGIFVDMFNWMFTLPDLGNINFVYFIIALPMFPFGVASMVNSGLPVSPIEELPLHLTERLNVKYVYAKSSIEVIYVILALAFGLLSGNGLGAIMIGTMIITIYIGPAIAFFRKLLPSLREQ